MDAIDLFAGMGGTTTGAEQAGARVLWAANHWRVAVDVHTVNHPHVKHACQDLHQARWEDTPKHDLQLASPACTGHSRARGGREAPSHDAARATAWAVVSCAEYRRPKFLLIENVPDMRRWILQPAWMSALRALGYSLREHVVNAADCGTPQSRERLLIVASHGTLFAPDLGVPNMPRVAASTCIDWDAGAWSQVDRPNRAAKTLARVKEGRRVFGDRFLLAFYGSEKGGRSLDKPLGTITTRGRHAIVDGNRMRMLLPDETRRAMGFPDGYHIPTDPKVATHMLGNAVPPPLARWAVSQLMAVA